MSCVRGPGVHRGGEASLEVTMGVYPSSVLSLQGQGPRVRESRTFTLTAGRQRKMDEFSLQRAPHVGGPRLISACFLLQPVKDYFPLGETAEGNEKAAADTAVIKKKEQENRKKKKTCRD